MDTQDCLQQLGNRKYTVPEVHNMMYMSKDMTYCYNLL